MAWPAAHQPVCCPSYMFKACHLSYPVSTRTSLLLPPQCRIIRGSSSSPDLTSGAPSCQEVIARQGLAWQDHTFQLVPNWLSTIVLLSIAFPS